MKKIIILFIMILSTVSYSQTAITNSNIYQAVDDWIITPSYAETVWGHISDWDVSNVTNMELLFLNRDSFNDNISGWNVSNVTNMYEMFKNTTSFNQPIGDWDVSSVTNMERMFLDATSFNQPIGDWDTSNVTSMDRMFLDADAFNQPIGNWDVINVVDMSYMFKNATSFDQPIGDWDISSITDMSGMFINTGISVSNFDSTIINWYNNTTNLPVNVTLGGNVGYCECRDWLYLLENNYGWTIDTDEDIGGGGSGDFNLDCSTAGVDDQNQLYISIYPNPTSDMVFIDGNHSQLKVVMYDILGKQVMNKSITNNIDISQLEKGVYILQLSDGAKLTTKRINHSFLYC